MINGDILWKPLDFSKVINKKKYIYCRCICGKEKYVYEYYLKTGKSRSCGCKGKILNIDDEVNSLTILSNPYIDENKRELGRLVKCRCRCQKEVELEFRHVYDGKIKSCGCVGREKTVKRNKLNRKGTLLKDGQKKCSKCLTFKDKKNYKKSKQNDDGLSSICNFCCWIKRCATKFNMTEEEILKTVGETKACQICNKSNILCLDHCHKTGKIRGILCRNCNLGIGNFFDNPELIINASEYIKKHL